MSPAGGGGALLTSAQVASRLGVTAATVKRWADRGLLPCARTAGRHRRFREEDVERLGASLHGGAGALDAWIDRLLADPDRALLAALLAEHARLGAWWRVADELGAVVDHIGDCWAAGTLAIREEHTASARLARALARACEPMRVRHGRPRALLAAAEGELHTLGLSLLEPCLREAGWAAVWLGAPTPATEVAAAVERGEADVVLLSASRGSAPGALAAELELVGPACARRGVALLVGGHGPWPEAAGARVERTFAGLRAWMEERDGDGADQPTPRARKQEGA